MRFNGIGDRIFVKGQDGRDRIDYDALIDIIGSASKATGSEIDPDAVRDGILPRGSYDYSVYQRIWEAIVQERGTNDAWKIIYGLWRVRSGSMPIGVVNCNR